MSDHASAEFEGQIRRLKECLGVAEDQEVARVLDMTKAALSDRRKRGSFPVGKVLAAKAKYPQIDVAYVLGGEREQGHAAAVIEHAAKFSSTRPQPERERLEAALAVHGEQMRATLATRTEISGLLAWCDDDALDLLLRLTARLASQGRASAPAAPREPQTKTVVKGSVENLAGRDVRHYGAVPTKRKPRPKT